MHLAAPAPFGGIEQVVEDLSAAQRARGHRVTVVSVVDSHHASVPYEPGLRDAGVSHIRHVSPGRRYLWDIRFLRSLVEELDADVVHTHGYRMDVLGRLATGKGVASVTTVHGFTGGSRVTRLFERIQERALRHFDAVVAVSRSLGARLEEDGLDGARLHVIQNAWTARSPMAPAEARRLLGLAEDGFHVGWVGRLGHEKGADVLLDALAEAHRQGAHNVTGHFLGDGPEKARLEGQAHRLGLDGRVRWHGYVPAAAGYLPAFDAFVLSSRTEGTPMVLLEAMAAGVPVVATRVGGVPDMVTDAEAILVQSEDSGGLARAIAQLAGDAGAARGRAVRARALLRDRFAMAPWVDRYDAVYGAAMQRAGRGVRRW